MYSISYRTHWYNCSSFIENGLVLHSNSIELQHVQITLTLKAKTDFYNTIVEETHDLQIQTYMSFDVKLD